MLEKRRKLMEAWAAYCGRKPDTAKVILIKRRDIIEPHGWGSSRKLGSPTELPRAHFEGAGRAIMGTARPHQLPGS